MGVPSKNKATKILWKRLVEPSACSEQVRGGSWRMHSFMATRLQCAIGLVSPGPLLPPGYTASHRDTKLLELNLKLPHCTRGQYKIIMCTVFNPVHPHKKRESLVLWCDVPHWKPLGAFGVTFWCPSTLKWNSNFFGWGVLFLLFFF